MNASFFQSLRRGFTILFIAATTFVQAQIPPPDPPPEEDPCAGPSPPPECGAVPLNEDIQWIILGGVLFGVILLVKTGLDKRRREGAM